MRNGSRLVGKGGKEYAPSIAIEEIEINSHTIKTVLL